MLGQGRATRAGDRPEVASLRRGRRLVVEEAHRDEALSRPPGTFEMRRTLDVGAPRSRQSVLGWVVAWNDTRICLLVPFVLQLTSRIASPFVASSIAGPSSSCQCARLRCRTPGPGMSCAHAFDAGLPPVLLRPRIEGVAFLSRHVVVRHDGRTHTYLQRVQEKAPADESEGIVEDVLTRFVTDLIDRLTGPLSFRLILQPMIATFFAVRDRLKAERQGRPPYFRSLFTVAHPERRELLQEAWKAIIKVFSLAVVLDLVSRDRLLAGFIPVESLVVAIILAIVPYVLLRGWPTGWQGPRPTRQDSLRDHRRHRTERQHAARARPDGAAH